MVYFKRAEFWHRTPSKVAASSGTPTMSVAGSSASDSSAGPQANPVKRRRPQDIPPKPFISRSLTQEGWRSRTLTAERSSVTLQDMNERFRVGVDIGGTFTNFVLFYKTAGNLKLEKTYRTPQDLRQAPRHRTAAYSKGAIQEPAGS